MSTPVIRQLSPTLVNQIAAGEVVERPASVIKELVENSLDAGATQIEVVIRRAGRELISVTDNGCGMTPEDACLSLERHATSKISSFQDLLRVGTMGFRGEAIPSIASVSHFTLRSSTVPNDGKESPPPTEIRVEGGTLVSQTPCAMPGGRGTHITIEHLFYNVPARRKFLKSDSTELSQCVQILTSIALANPTVGFKFFDNKRSILDLPAGQSLEKRLENIFSAATISSLCPISATSSSGVPNGVSLEGFLSPVGVTFPTREKILFFVNRRCVDAKIFHQALRVVYGQAMTRGRYPAAFVFLTLPPQDLDVNVHPAKREVRFRAERDIFAFLVNQLGRALNLPASLGSSADGTVGMSFSTNGLPALSPSLPVYPSKFPGPLNGSDAPIKNENVSPAVGETLECGKKLQKSDNSSLPPNFSAPFQSSLRVAQDIPSSRHGWQFLSFLSADFALFSTPEGLVILSIPNAQERVAFQKIISGFSSRASQTLLIPALLQIDGVLSDTLVAHEQFIANQGFMLSLFGHNTFRLEAIPAWLSPENGFLGAPEHLLLEELSTLAEGAVAHGDDRLKRQALAQRLSRRARVGLSHAGAARALAEALLSCEFPLKSPTGAPTLWQISFEELQKKFVF